ncbi:MAG: ribbon-helix-helix domain-containing protein [Hyphomonadaceae bacterium]
MAKAPSLAARLAAVAAQPNTSPYQMTAPANQDSQQVAEPQFVPAPVAIAEPMAAAPVFAPPNFAMPVPQKAKARDGRVMVAGYFSPELSRSLRILAAERDVTVQHLVGEGLDFVLRHYGKHPMGER